MMVTASPAPAAIGLSAEQRWSIRLAVAQWLRSARAVASAQDGLRALGTPPAEIVRRRRAESADAALARLLRLAVTVVITRGRLEASDRSRPSPLSDTTVQAVVEATADAYAGVLLAESSGSAASAHVVDMEIGDY